MRSSRRKMVRMRAADQLHRTAFRQYTQIGEAEIALKNECSFVPRPHGEIIARQRINLGYCFEHTKHRGRHDVLPMLHIGPPGQLKGPQYAFFWVWFSVTCVTILDECPKNVGRCPKNALAGRETGCRFGGSPSQLRLKREVNNAVRG
jgi:hypothetical protein